MFMAVLLFKSSQVAMMQGGEPRSIQQMTLLQYLKNCYSAQESDNLTDLAFTEKSPIFTDMMSAQNSEVKANRWSSPSEGLS